MEATASHAVARNRPFNHIVPRGQVGERSPTRMSPPTPSSRFLQFGVCLAERRPDTAGHRPRRRVGAAARRGMGDDVDGAFREAGLRARQRRRQNQQNRADAARPMRWDHGRNSNPTIGPGQTVRAGPAHVSCFSW